MLKLAIIFFIISVVAGILGFTGIAKGARTTVFLAAAFLVAGLAACEPKPPKPKVDFTHAGSTLP